MGLRVAETSDFLMRQVAACWRAAYECGYASKLARLRKKEGYVRRELVAMGDLMTALKPDCLLAGAAAEGQILVGARRKIELEAWFSGGRNDGDVLVEVIATQGRDDVYELAEWNRERTARSGGIYRTLRAENLEWPIVGAEIARMILADKAMQATYEMALNPTAK